jgi:hypothetical protein
MDYDTWLSTDPADALEAEIERRIGELEAAESRAESAREDRAEAKITQRQQGAFSVKRCGKLDREGER